MYDYKTDRVYGCDEQIGYVSGDRRTNLAYDVRLRASTMSMSQTRDHSVLYGAGSSVYGKDAWMMPASSPHASLAASVNAEDDVQDAYELYAVTEEPTVPGVAIAEECDDISPPASLLGGIDL